jgi:high frequency lysogenization protein
MSLPGAALDDDHGRVLALAGMVMALAQVRRLAETGSAEAAAMRVVLASVFTVDAEDAPSVYGGVAALGPGLRLLDDLLAGRGDDPQLMRLAYPLLRLERRFSSDAETLRRVRAGIERLQADATRDGADHPEVISGLARLYSQTLSLLTPRILVQGNPHYLGQAGVVADVRALLLAAMRSAVLWRQLGGSGWQLLLGRARLRRVVADLRER